MLDDDAYRCRVCGLYSEEPPWGLDGRLPSHDICPCCGAESGYEDTLPISARAYRERWIAKGAPWFQPRMKPADWDLAAQLAHVPKDFE